MMMTIMMMMIMTNPFTTNLVVKGTVVKGSVVKGAHPMTMAMAMMTTMAQVRVCTNMTNNPDMLTDRELEEVTAVFKSFETGLREATIHPKVYVGVSEFL